MQNSIGKKIASTIILGFLIQGSTTAQSLTDPVSKSGVENSPYSQFGIGTMSLTPNASLRGMAGTGAGYNDGFTMNPENPASYGFLKVTTFEAAFEAKSRTVTFENTEGNNSFTGGVGYLGFVFPIRGFGGFAFGLKPVSNIFYQLSDSVNLTPTDKARRTYVGNGGLQNAYAGISGKYKNFSIGFNGGYTFGSITNQHNLYNIDASVLRNYESAYTTGYGGFDWNAGLLYHIDLKKERFMNIGMTYSGGAELTGTRNGSTTAISSFYSDKLERQVVLNVDTITSYKNTKGVLNMPSSIGFGIHAGKRNVLDINADVKIYDWSGFKKFDAIDSVRDQSFRLGLGFAYTPNANALYTQKGSYFSAVTYRAGFYYNRDYVFLRNTDLNEIGGTIGMSFPLKRTSGNYQIGRIHTSLNVGSRGTLQYGLAREVFVNFTLGASLSDIWFIKSLYD